MLFVHQFQDPLSVFCQHIGFCCYGSLLLSEPFDAIRAA
uniref:Uncharacterized protein n=1 Tax=Arundo donax TaxID=35708 RepID=A0A0A9I2V5_ARUDO